MTLRWGMWLFWMTGCLIYNWQQTHEGLRCMFVCVCAVGDGFAGPSLHHDTWEGRCGAGKECYQPDLSFTPCNLHDLHGGIKIPLTSVKRDKNNAQTGTYSDRKHLNLLTHGHQQVFRVKGAIRVKGDVILPGKWRLLSILNRTHHEIHCPRIIYVIMMWYSLEESVATISPTSHWDLYLFRKTKGAV